MRASRGEELARRGHSASHGSLERSRQLRIGVVTRKVYARGNEAGRWALEPGHAGISGTLLCDHLRPRRCWQIGDQAAKLQMDRLREVRLIAARIGGVGADDDRSQARL